MIKTDARNDKGRRKTSLTIFTSPFIARVPKGCSRFACERCWRPNITEIF